MSVPSGRACQCYIRTAACRDYDEEQEAAQQDYGPGTTVLGCDVVVEQVVHSGPVCGGSDHALATQTLVRRVDLGRRPLGVEPLRSVTWLLAGLLGEEL